MPRGAALLLLLGLAGCGAASMNAGMECAIYARAVTGLRLSGDAADWWDQAAPLYSRGSVPAPGAVLVFRRAGRVPHGHVSVVLAVTSPREIRVEQANWVHGRITQDEPVIDVSPRNDWTEVRVWWQPAAAMGSTTYRTYGFIGPQDTPLAARPAGPSWPGEQDPPALFACKENGLAPCEARYPGTAPIGEDHG